MVLSPNQLLRRVRLFTLAGALELVEALELDVLDVPELADLAEKPSLQLGLALSESAPTDPTTLMRNDQ